MMAPMDIIKLAATVGKKAFWSVEGTKVPVDILDVRQVWSRVDYYCKPLFGEGEKWISHERIELIKDAYLDHVADAVKDIFL